MGFYAEARGHLSQGDRALLIGRTRIAVSPKGDFIAVLPVTAQAQAYLMTTIDLRGNLRQLTVVIDVPRFEQIKKERLRALNRTHHFTLGLGYSLLSYQETGIQEVNQPSLTLKAGYRGAFGSSGILSRITYSLSGYITALPISSNDPDATMRFLGFNARLGYAIPRLFGPDSTWSANIGFGYYFTTMLVSASNPNAVFGFADLMGLQIFPAIQKTIDPKDSIMAYFKFSPISSGIALTNLGSNREIAFGLVFTRRVSPGLDWLITFDWANLQDKVTNSSQVQSSSMSFGTGIGW